MKKPLLSSSSTIYEHKQINIFPVKKLMKSQESFWPTILNFANSILTVKNGAKIPKQSFND